jgi:hypothetical protein
MNYFAMQTNPIENQLRLSQTAAIDGNTRQQALNAFANGVGSMVNAPAQNALRDNAVTQSNVQTAQAERELIAPLLDGVARSDNPAAAYAEAVRRVQGAGIDIPDELEAYDPENFQMLQSMYAMPEAELTDFQRKMQLAGPDNAREAALVSLGLRPSADARLRGQVGDRPLTNAAKLRSDLDAGRINQEDFDRETAPRQGIRVGKGGVLEVAPMGRSATNTEQKALASEINLYSQLQNVGELAGLDENGRMVDPSMLTYRGQAEDFFAKKAEKLGIEPSDLQREAMVKRTKFVTGVEQLFNAYRKEITGAAAAVQELDRLKKSFINMDMSPTEFEAAFQQYTGELQRSMRVRRKLLREGFDLRSEDGGDRMDRLFLSGGDDDPADRFVELVAEHGDDDKAHEIMMQEGY